LLDQKSNKKIKSRYSRSAKISHRSNLKKSVSTAYKRQALFGFDNRFEIFFFLTSLASQLFNALSICFRDPQLRSFSESLLHRTSLQNKRSCACTKRRFVSGTEGRFLVKVKGLLLLLASQK
jgi:hypothetical protein